MLTTELIERSIKYKSILNKEHNSKNKNNITANSSIKLDNPYFIPKQNDTLFWCFYIMKNGDSQYEMLDNINIILEKKYKIEYIEKIRKEKQLIKTYKFATLTHIENQLANEKIIDLNTFLALCVFENLNILYVHKKMCYELLMNDTNQNHIIHRLDNPFKYAYEGISQEKAELYKSTLFKVDNIAKPVKSLSYYKVQDLIDFCNKLAIETINTETGKAKSKKDLYESLIQYF